MHADVSLQLKTNSSLPADALAPFMYHLSTVLIDGVGGQYINSSTQE